MKTVNALHFLFSLVTPQGLPDIHRDKLLLSVFASKKACDARPVSLRDPAGTRTLDLLIKSQ
jgi:hypothetical protein